MTRTTDKWAELLDGTTEGPWNAGKGEIYGPRYAEVLTAETETRGSGYMEYEVPLLAGERLDRDLPLAASAPDAVAEVIRLRRELETVRDKHLRLADEMRPGIAHTVTKGYADNLDRILNGDTDDRNPKKCTHYLKDTP